MDEGRELVDPAQLGVALAVLSGLSLVVAPVLLGMGRKRGAGGADWVKGGLLSAAGTLLFPLWLLYNAIENSLGLDSVAGLLINVALFIGMGAALGIVLRRLWPTAVERPTSAPAEPR